MALYTSATGAGGILPDQWGELIIAPLRQMSRALDERCATQVVTASHEFHVPVLTADATASWVAEGAEITPSDPTLDEIVVVPAKVAGLTILSREMAMDSSPAATAMVGQSIAANMQRALDNAFFGSMASPAPAGLGSLADADVSRRFTGTLTPTDLDTFAQVMTDVAVDGGDVTAWVANPVDALTFSNVKVASGWAQPLLGPDAANPTTRSVFGVPLLTSPQVPQGLVYGLDADRVVTVLREDVAVEMDGSVFFTSDRVAVRATMRCAFAFPAPKSVGRLAIATS